MHKSIWLDILAGTFVVAIVFAIGWVLGSWTGDLKGDDAYYHVGIIQYIADNFPNLNWYHQSFAGYPPLQFEAPLYYFLIAFAHIGTQLPVELLIQLGLILSTAVLGVSIYTLARFLNFPRILAMAFSLLMFTTPEIWNWIVVGGGYKRVVALPFLFLSLAFVYRHLNQINSDSERIRIYTAVVVSLSLVAMLHPLIAQFTLPMVLLVYILGVRGWPRKFYYLAKTLVPVAGLAAWLYLPLFRAYYLVMRTPVAGSSVHDTDLMQRSWLLSIPSHDSWSNTIGPLILPLALFCFILMLMHQAKIRKAWHTYRLELSFVIVATIFSLYFLAFGWFPMPKSLYLMATFDHVIWLGISLLLLSVCGFSILAQLGIFLKLKKWLSLSAQTFVVILVVAATVANIPFLQHFTHYPNPMNPTSYIYEIKYLVDVAKENSLPGYRLYNSQRRIQSWLYFVHPDLETSGGRNRNNAPHKYYHQWADLTVSYRLNVDDLTRTYFEDSPQVLRSISGERENFYSSMFWLDWYGASGPVLLSGLYPQWKMVLGYSHRPQFFQEYKAGTMWGDMFFYKYDDSSPTLVSSEAHVVAVPFSPEDAPPFYTDLLDVLSSLNLNSQYIIPVKLENSNGLSNFEHAVVDYACYVQNKDVMEVFIREGGHLLVMESKDGEPNPVNADLLRMRLSLQVKATPLEAPEASTILAQADQGVLVYRENMGQGTVTFCGISLNNLIESNSPVGAILLLEMMVPEFEMNQINPKIAASKVSWTTDGTIAGISSSLIATTEAAKILNWAASWRTENAQGEVNTASPYQELVARFSGGADHDQVNFSAYLSDQVPVKSAGFIEFEIWCDGEPRIDVSFASSRKWNSHPVKIKKGEWVRNLIPLSAFRFPVGDFDLSKEFIFAVNDNPEAGLAGNGDKVLVRVRHFRIYASEKTDEQPVLHWVADYDKQHNQVNWKLPLPEPLSANDDALLNFSLWHDGGLTTGIDIVLEQEGAFGFLYYNLDQSVWKGWKDFSIPLSAFQWKEDQGWEQIKSFDSIVIAVNQDPPYPKELVMREFIIRDLKMIKPKAPSFVRLEGEWLQANKFKVVLQGHRAVLWKESYTSSWRVTTEEGNPVDYYFAGPGLIYLVAPEGDKELTFELPFPIELLVGLGISATSLLGMGSYSLACRRRASLLGVKVK